MINLILKILVFLLIIPVYCIHYVSFVILKYLLDAIAELEGVQDV